MEQSETDLLSRKPDDCDHRDNCKSQIPSQDMERTSLLCKRCD